ncbi:hypothetical protein RJ639_032192 [Escallonia herrerae]|uniref:Fe2OG dioxygenase domain-containing protein n=1 Tax=Escallonia herrerae TaxID=1293975 RepID=A0AA88WUA7_9ASTE|nr:hypothetical protein RJ639_032192 [Escallonia herrerae]
MVSNGDPAIEKSEFIQEIIRRNPSCIPERYLRSEEDKAKDVDMSALAADIPVLDLSLLSNGSKEELQKLDNACKDWGFFQVTNHGITAEVLQGTKKAAAEFFNLPIQEKTKYLFRPEFRQGYGQPFPVAEDERLDWSDSLLLFLDPSQNRCPELWPATPPEFKGAVEAYSAGVRKITEELFGCLSLIMGLEKDALLGLHEEMRTLMRMNYYPLCCRHDQVLGLNSHTDVCTITILMQDDDVTGLQIRYNGGWVPVKPLPNSLIVNVGDILEIWSNGKYKSIEHRAVTSETRERISVGLFFSPHTAVEIEPLEDILATQKCGRKYKKVKYGDYLKGAIQRRQQGKEHILKFKI